MRISVGATVGVLRWALIGAATLLPALPCGATPAFFSAGDVADSTVTATHPDERSPFEAESTDELVAADATTPASVAFTGILLPTASATATVGRIGVEIYRAFRRDPDAGETFAAPAFTPPQGPADVESRSEVPFDLMDSASITFRDPFDLPSDHDLFVPQVERAADGAFRWLSTTLPIEAPAGTPYATDFRSSARDANPDPAWRRVHTEAARDTSPGLFNTGFTLTGTLPASSTLAVLALACIALGMRRRLHF